MDTRPVDRYWVALFDLLFVALVAVLASFAVKGFPGVWPLVLDVIRVSSWGCMWGAGSTGFGGGHTVGV